VLTLVMQGQTSMRVGDTAQWQAVANMSDGSQKIVTPQTTWASLTPAVASVNGSGLVSALSTGTTTLQGFYQGQSASATITVSSGSTVIPTVTGLAITGTPTVGVGQTTQLQAVAQYSDGSSQTVTALASWTSGAPAKASVSGGLVAGIDAGSAVISAVYGGKTAQATVTINSAPVQKQLIGIDVDATVDLSQLSLGQLVELRVYGVYSDGSKQDVTSSAAITTDDPLLRVDGPGLLNVLLTLTSALLDPDHVVNVQYGGFTESVNLHIKAPVIQSLQLGSGGLLSTSLNSQLPALQAVFAGNQPATLDADFPGVQWNVEPRGALGSVLNLLGVALNQVITVNSNGQLVATNVPLLNQVLSLVGGALPVNLNATYGGVSSNTAQAVIGS
jgi:hypothetical protein